MKREGNLIEKIADMKNLEWAFWKAQRGKKDKKEVIAYQKQLNSNLKILQTQLLTNTCEVGNYHFFKIYDPKERQICAAPFSERVLHHAIMNICHENFEKFQVFDSYATRLNKGTYAALERAAYFHKKYRYFLKIDCRKYFDTIDQQVLKQQLFRRFKDPQLLQLFYKIIDSYEVEEGKGLPIGNLTSQYFANHYLAYADRYLLENQKVEGMVRYMDDLIIWSNSSESLRQISINLQDFCYTQLKVTFKHNYQNISAHGVVFLGFKLFTTHTELSQKSKKRFKTAYSLLEKKYAMMAINQTKYHQCLVSLFVRACKVNSYAFRKSLHH